MPNVLAAESTGGLEPSSRMVPGSSPSLCHMAVAEEAIHVTNADTRLTQTRARARARVRACVRVCVCVCVSERERERERQRQREREKESAREKEFLPTLPVLATE